MVRKMNERLVTDVAERKRCDNLWSQGGYSSEYEEEEREDELGEEYNERNE